MTAIDCPSCGTRVYPTADRQCPACRRPIDSVPTSRIATEDRRTQFDKIATSLRASRLLLLCGIVAYLLVVSGVVLFWSAVEVRLDDLEDPETILTVLIIFGSGAPCLFPLYLLLSRAHVIPRLLRCPRVGWLPRLALKASAISASSLFIVGVWLMGLIVSSGPVEDHQRQEAQYFTIAALASLVLPFIMIRAPRRATAVDVAIGKSPSALVVLTLSPHFLSLPLIYITTPSIYVNAVKLKLPWGSHAVRCGGGRCHITVEYPWLVPALGRAQMEISFWGDEIIRLHYRAGFLFCSQSTLSRG